MRKLVLERPDEHVCPLSHDIMVDPVMTSDGQVYERVYIERWLQDNDTSPMTKEKHVGPLVPNHPLRGLIERWDEDAHAYFVTIHKRYREDKMDVQPAVAAAPAEESEEEEEVVLESGVLGDPVVRD